MELKSNAVEEWAKEFENAKKGNITDREKINMIYSIVIGEKLIDNDADLRESLETKKSPSMATVIYHRAKHFHNYTLTPSAALMAELFVRNFGESTMLCAYMQYKAHQLGVNTITTSVFVQEIMPNIMPDEEEIDRLWELQKFDTETRDKIGNSYSDNGLDCRLNYESIMTDSKKN